MALLQIAEPGQFQAPHQHRLAVGIDLGTTNSLVATVRSGIAEALADADGDTILPSVVRYFPDGTVRVGVDARRSAAEDPANTIVSVKRFMGRTLESIVAENAKLPYEFAVAEGQASVVPRIQVYGRAVTAVEVSAEILKVLRARAEAVLGGELTGAVVTVPAHFDDAQRQATKDAARLAGIQVLRLLNEPTAAAVAYGLDATDDGAVVVYDLGGGTFDISILSLERGVFQVLATGGDTALGGDDFDALIVEWILQQAGFDSETSMNKTVVRRLFDVAVSVKESLTVEQAVDIDFEFDNYSWSGRLTQEVFNSLIHPLVKRTLQACRQVLLDADMTVTDVREVVMVGGSTRVPYVQDCVSGFFSRRVLTSIDPDRVVALGAAIQADILAGNKPNTDILLLDVIPLSLGVETMGGLVEKVIPRNSAIPVARAQEFTTFKDGQSAMSIHVVQGERELVSDCRSLARFDLRGIPPMPAGAARIRVTFQVDADGLLGVTAQEQTTGQEASIQVKPSFGLSDDEIAGMLRDSMTYAEDDLKKRRLAEKQVEANRVLEALASAMSKDAERFLTPEEQQMIFSVRDKLIDAQQGNDYVLIQQCIENLEEVSKDFVSRRMDSSLHKLMAGHQVDEFGK